MNLAAGILGIGFGLFHALPSLAAFKEPAAPRGSHQTGAIPVWARALWFVLALVALAGSMGHLVSNSVGTAVVIAVGAFGIWLMAIANGFWIHGRPTLSHHLIRGIVVAALIALAFLGLE